MPPPTLLLFLLLPVLPLCISQTAPYPPVILNEQGKVFPPVNKQLYQGKEFKNLSAGRHANEGGCSYHTRKLEG